MSQTLVFAVPGALGQLTGGSLFDRRIVEGLRQRGESVQVMEMPGSFPMVDEAALAGARQALASVDADQVWVMDGLVLPAFAPLLPLSRAKRVVGFIHHPLSMETGLSPAQVQHFEVLEGNAWRSLDGVICASPSTRKSVLRAGVDPARVQVSSPGVDVPAWPTQPPTRGLTGGLRLLCVAHVTARKGHAVLVQALAMLRDQAWTLDCYGSLARDPNIAASLRADIQSLGLGERITLHGEQPPECLSSAWWQADAFVLPSHHEGYGMVLTEAIAHGLPIVSTRAGAIAQTAPALASVLVEPGDAHALAHALQALLLDRSRLAAMRQAARVARESLVSWHDAIGHWHMALQRLLSLERAAS